MIGVEFIARGQDGPRTTGVAETNQAEHLQRSVRVGEEGTRYALSVFIYLIQIQRPSIQRLCSRTKCPKGNVWDNSDLDADELHLACSHGIFIICLG